MKYEISNNIKNNDYQKLYDDYFPEKAQIMKSFISNNKINYFIHAKENDKIIGSMGIDNFDDDCYMFSNLVVNENYTGQGVATGIIRMAVKFLIDLGAKKIVNHKRENIIPHTTFTDMGFKLVKYSEEIPEYKWNYELNTKEAINMWTQYKGI